MKVFLSFLTTLVSLGVFLLVILAVGLIIMLKGYYIVAGLLLLFGLVSYYKFINIFTLILLWLAYVSYLFSPLLYEIIIMNTWEAVIKNLLSVIFLFWLFILHEENKVEGNDV